MQRSLSLEILQKIELYGVLFHLLWNFRYQLDDPYLNLNALHEFQCDKTVATSFKVGLCQMKFLIHQILF